MKKIILFLVATLLLAGCAPSSGYESPQNSVQENEVDINSLPVVGITRQGRVYRLNESCFIYENSWSNEASQAFCMTDITIEDLK